MIGYYSDNTISQSVMKAFAHAGLETRHIKDFQKGPSVFYGMLRGSGAAMIRLASEGIDFWYVDNGYFDAHYMDRNKFKELDGKYRIVRNDMIEPYTGSPARIELRKPMNILALPPSPYTAFMYDTTPEDWLYEIKQAVKVTGDNVRVRTKDEIMTFRKQVREFDAVIAFNSMSAMEAIELGKPVYTTHGIVRNGDLFNSVIPYYDHQTLCEFYKNKQHTLEEIKQGGLECLKS